LLKIYLGQDPDVFKSRIRIRSKIVRIRNTAEKQDVTAGSQNVAGPVGSGLSCQVWMRIKVGSGFELELFCDAS
jgi:hypothetical protein